MISRRFLLFVLLASLNLLSGCATNVIDKFTSEQNYDGLYLRGVFSWWEADEKYKLVEIENEKYATTIELIADGQPYDFKFADADWTPGLNCGYASQSDRVVEVGESSRSDCESTDQNFRFTPKETGVFQFSIDFSGFGSAKVMIEKIRN